MSLSPAHIHTHQHRSPVLSLRTTSTGIDLQDSLHRIFLLAEHILQFQVFNGLDSLLVVLVHLFFGDHLVLIEVKSQLQLVGKGTHLLISVKPLLDAFHLFHLLLCPCAVLPEVWCLRTQVLLLVFDLLLVDFEVAMQGIRPFQHILQLILSYHSLFPYCGSKLFTFHYSLFPYSWYIASISFA